MLERKVGAPKGGRVHWILHALPTEFKGAYLYEYNYKYHKYVFYRLTGHRLYDVFIVMRTSKHYFRAVYCNVVSQEYELFGHYSPERIAEKMYDIFLQAKEIEINLENKNEKRK